MARKGTHIFADLQSVLNTRQRRLATFFALAWLAVVLTLAPGWFNRVAGQVPLPQPLIAQSSVGNTQQLLEQGRNSFQAGQLKQAAEQWQQAAQVAAAQDDRLTQAIALSNLALAYQQLGEWSNANTAIANSLKALETEATSPAGKPNSATVPQVRAQVLNTQGKLQYAAGRFEQALESWQRATNDYSKMQDTKGVTLSLLNQTEALKALGLHRRANTILESLYQTRAQQPTQLQLTTLLNYGDNLRLLGRLAPDQPSGQPDAQTVLQEGLALAQRSQSPSATVSALVGLGNTARAQQQLQATRYIDQPKQLQTTYQQELRYYQDLASSDPAVQRTQAWLREQSTLSTLPTLSATQLAQVQTLSTQIENQLSSLPTSRYTVYARLQLAENLINVGGTTAAPVTQLLNTAAKQAESIGDFQIQSYALWRKFYFQALQFYQQAAAIASANSISSLNGLLNQQSLLLNGNDDTRNSQQRSQASTLSADIQAQLERAPLSHQTLYSQIHFAQNLLQLGDQTNLNRARQILEATIKQAEQLGDLAAQSYALGNLGASYEQQQQWQMAQPLTQQALSLAKAMKSASLAYRWEWQLGRLLKAQRNTPAAIEAYTQAVANLNAMREDLATLNTDNTDIQFSFRLNAEPVYLELVELLLQSGNTGTGNQNLEQARSVIESLQVAEIEDFFQAACVPKSVEIEGVDPQAAVIYPIVLPDRLDVIVSLYDANAPKRFRLKQYSFPVQAEEVEQTTNQFRQSLVPSASVTDRFAYGQKFYDWLIRSAETDLAQANVKTLVFIMNGNLRNIPMAALHDGKQFLVQKYNIALSPGLQLIEPKPLQRQNINALVAGLTQATQGFPALPSVAAEVQKIQSTISSQVIMNENLTNQNLEKALSTTSFNTIHLATHGQFSSNADQTFILTWNKKLNVKEFDALLKISEKNDTTPVELLVLSACQTASGDKRATLGLAGVAIRSGARSTIGSLWPVNDETTAIFMTTFYEALNRPGISKAEALSIAQRDVLTKYSSPYYWAPFVIVGNWL